MDTLEHAIQLMKPACFMASVDLKDAYYSVPVHDSHQKYLKFLFGGKYYQYTCLPNGLASAPRIFTKLLKPVYSALRSMGHVSSAYIDDSYLQGDTYIECYNNVVDTAKLFSQLGFCVHPEKSMFEPKQEIVFLGFILNSLDMTVTPTKEKIHRIISSAAALLETTTITIRQLAEFIGIVVSNFPGAQYGPLHYRQMEYEKYWALLTHKGNYSSPITLSLQAKMEIRWWLSNVQNLKRNIICDNPTTIIKSDASTQGWGAVLDENKTGGDGQSGKHYFTSTFWN